MLDSIFTLSGRTALITGGAGLLGRQHAEAVLVAGGNVVLSDVDLEGLERVKHEIPVPDRHKLRAIKIDVTSESNIEAAYQQLASEGIRIDILINNAARNPTVGSTLGLKNSSRLEDFNLQTWQLDLDVGLTGAFLCAKIFGRVMAKQKSGIILNVSSDLGVIAPDQRLYATDDRLPDQQDVKPVTYSVVKHGLIGLTKYLATYWADCGVRSNALLPGGVFNGQNDVFLSRVNKLIPLGRMARVNEYQGAVIFLCSEASSYMNGANLIVDGGRSVW